jgi:hypothetical protein
MGFRIGQISNAVVPASKDIFINPSFFLLRKESPSIDYGL